MQKKIQLWIANHLFRKRIDQENDIQVYLISFAALAFSFITHIYLLVAFAFWRVPIFLFLNICSILIYLILAVMHRKGLYGPVSLLLSVEVTLYTTIAIFLAGISTYIFSYYLLAAIFQVVLPYASARVRFSVFAVVFAVSTVSVALHLNATSIIVHETSLQNFLTLSNMYLLFFGILSQLYIGNLVTQITARLNVIKMEKLSVLANTDSLTNLYNRRYADYFFSDLSHDTSPYCVAMLDIDDFKVVNDTWGHECGDEVLKFLARFLVGHLRKADRTFRWGGEEFLLVLHNTDLKTAGEILDKLREQLQNTPIPTSWGELFITVTIGVAPLTKDVKGSIGDCDSKMYRGKQSGKNTVVI